MKTGADILDEYKRQSLATCQLTLEEMIDLELSILEQQRDELLAALKASRETLERVNGITGSNKVIIDTIWHTPYETLFDFMDEAIAKAEAV
jgi:hypothetical protein